MYKKHFKRYGGEYEVKQADYEPYLAAKHKRRKKLDPDDGYADRFYITDIPYNYPEDPEDEDYSYYEKRDRR